MVLTNAIYFNGKWMYPFDKSSTSSSIFHVSSGESVKTVFMNQTRTFPYYEDEEVQALSLPYQGGRMSMLVILPKKVEDWKIISRVLDYDRIRLVASGMADTEVQLALPRFRSELRLNLRNELVSMGVEQAFSRDADLSGMTGEKNLFISEIIHKAFIEVTEAGTEAAAATAGIIALKSALSEKPVQFKADHPFIYLLIDEVSGCVIFMGRLVRPSEIV
jgi:serpin B